MSDPRRLLGGEASDFEKELLRSWGTEQPSEGARAAVLTAVGIGAGAAAVAAIKAGAAAGGSVAPKAAATVSAIAIGKWAAGVVVAMAAAGATVGYVRHAGRVREPSTIPASAPAPAPSPPSTAAAPVDLPAEVSTASTGGAIPSTAPHVRSSDPRPRSSPRAHPSALGEQVSALDAARRALASGDAASALGQLDDYESRFRDGALVEEAEVLRVQALLAAGDRASASRVGERFLSAHPNSPHAARVRALLASP